MTQLTARWNRAVVDREGKAEMHERKPKEQHEQLLANADKEKIVQYLQEGQQQSITEVAVVLARQCTLFIHFLRLWQMRVAGLDPQLSSERYMHHVYSNRNALYRQLIRNKSA
jgi:hypothetical protein